MGLSVGARVGGGVGSGTWRVGFGNVGAGVGPGVGGRVGLRVGRVVGLSVGYRVGLLEGSEVGGGMLGEAVTPLSQLVQHEHSTGPKQSVEKDSITKEKQITDGTSPAMAFSLNSIFFSAGINAISSGTVPDNSLLRRSSEAIGGGCTMVSRQVILPYSIPRWYHHDLLNLPNSPISSGILPENLLAVRAILSVA